VLCFVFLPLSAVHFNRLTMKTAILAALISSAAAFAPAQKVRLNVM